MIRRQPGIKRPVTLFPYTTLFRSLYSIVCYWSFHAVLGGVDRAPARAGEPPMTWRDQLARDQMSDIRDFEAFGDHVVLKSYAYGDAGISPETTESPSVPAVEWAPPTQIGRASCWERVCQYV